MAADALACERSASADRGMRAVGGDEVDQRLRVLDVLHEVGPARVGLQLTVSGHLIEFPPRGVQRWNAGVPATRQVDGRLGRGAGRARLLRSASVTNSSISLPSCRVVPRTMAPAASSGVGAALRKGQRIEEGVDQADLAGGAKCRVEAVDRLGQHRVAEAIDRVGELGHDRRVDLGVVVLSGTKNGSIFGWMVRANSSNTRC